jgi:hypothetical protein
MSTKTLFPEGIRPITLQMSDRTFLEIQAVSYGEAILQVFNAEGERVTVPAILEIYDYEEKRYLDLTGDEVPLSMSNSYTIRYKGDVVLQQGGTIGRNQYPLSDEFVFPLTDEEKRKENSFCYTALVMGSFNEGSVTVKVSSTEGVAVGRSVAGQGIAEESYIMEVNEQQNEITLDNPTLGSTSRITLEIR